MDILEILEERFRKTTNCHKSINWEDCLPSLRSILKETTFMEKTGGEPNIFSFNGKLVVVDSMKEQSKERVNLCYDEKALADRKRFPPTRSVLRLIQNYNLKLLNEDEYLLLQNYGDFDTKTSSCLLTPIEVRQLGGAIFGDKRYSRTFIYHNGADSYYRSRGFRTVIYL